MNYYIYHAIEILLDFQILCNVYSCVPVDVVIIAHTNIHAVSAQKKQRYILIYVHYDVFIDYLVVIQL